MTICPKCDYERAEHEAAANHECPKCGIIYDKFNKIQDRINTETDHSETPEEYNVEGNYKKPVVMFFSAVLILGLAGYLMTKKPDAIEQSIKVSIKPDTPMVSDQSIEDEVYEPEIETVETIENSEEDNTVSFNTLPEDRKRFETHLTKKVSMKMPVANPPGGMFKIIYYDSPVGKLAAYVGLPKKRGVEYPAIIWLTGGFSNSISPNAWRPANPNNDQSARAFREKDIIMMYPSLRGGNMNPGYIETLYGEVDDVLAAYDYLSELSYVDSNRIYLGGHSTGGTLALLVAESTNNFHAIFSLGPTDNIRGYSKSLTFDTSNKKELELRSPINYLETITTPTYIFEGTGGNIGSLNTMRTASQNPAISFYALKGNHFSYIAPLTRVLADKINQEKYQNIDISFSGNGMVK